MRGPVVYMGPKRLSNVNLVQKLPSIYFVSTHNVILLVHARYVVFVWSPSNNRVVS